MVAPSLGILGGQSVQAARLLSAWAGDPDVDAWLVPVNPELPAPVAFLRRVKYARTVANEAVYIPSLFRELRKADVVHVFSASYFSFLLAPLPAIRVAHALGRPVVLNYRSGEAPDHLARSAVARRALASVARNVVPSRFLADVFATFGVGATVIPNIVDAERFAFRQRQPLRPRILSTRNFDSLYNVSCTIRAFRLVQDRWPDATLTLVGGGAEEPRLRALVHELQLRGVVFAGRVQPDAIAARYADHAIYRPSPNIDNMPTSIIEAYASGLPVVSTEAGGIPAILEHGTQGLLAPLNDHTTLAAHVLRLLDDHEYAARLAAAGRDSCRGCTWPAVRDQWLRVYSAVLDAHARRVPDVFVESKSQTGRDA